MAGGKIRKEKPSRGVGLYQGGGIQFHKSKGQHILKNPLIVDSIVQKAGIKSTDVVLEIGPGTGNLTKKLLEAAKSVVAIELDPRMVLELERRFPSHSYPLKASNLLYYYLFFYNSLIIKCTSLFTGDTRRRAKVPLFRCAVIMYQSEFAMRLVAQPGDTLYSRLSVNTQLKARVTHLLKVGKNNFRPPPKVDSSVVRIEPRKPDPAVNDKEVDGLLRMCFMRKNKTLGAIFKHKKVLSMLEKNYKTLEALQYASVLGDSGNLAMETDDVEIDDDNDDDDDADMDDDDGDTKGSEEYKSKVMGVLKQGDFEDKRSRMLAKTDFIHLLSLFNKAGIHFS
ncbi:ribosomal RNA small subunit methyltransferase-like isoform X2 [Rutidosis leptorrhynchoides]|uniref:ribosomal RNA small subunit methyltransferase-like isoform X2 n=1 Tax=Rutidosis leptorrhynchoides TaxID=125765 RepID=UPI003A990F51